MTQLVRGMPSTHKALIPSAMLQTFKEDLLSSAQPFASALLPLPLSMALVP